MSNGQFLRKWVLHPVMLGLVAGIAIACQPDSSGVSSPPANPDSAAEPSPADPNAESSSPEISTPDPIPADQAIYQNDTYGFQFSYSPNEFVVDEATIVPSEDESQIAAIEIWTQEHDQEIRSGAYEGGTEYPANVSIRVHTNPQQLPLQEWIEQSNSFTATRDFEEVTVADQDAIAFQSSGLYENKNVVFVSPDGSNIIVIAMAQIGGEEDALYQAAFDQVVDSFTFVDQSAQ